MITAEGERRGRRSATATSDSGLEEPRADRYVVRLKREMLLVTAGFRDPLRTWPGAGRVPVPSGPGRSDFP